MTEIIKAASALRAGNLVVFPTETVYGLGADATNGKAVAAIFAAKQRPQINPLIIHIENIGLAKFHVLWTEPAELLAAAFWPGPLTLVLKRKKSSPISMLASAGLGTLALRCPAHEMAQALLHESGLPIAAPSANPSGKLSVTRADHIADEISAAAQFVLDAGPSVLGIESTVVDARAEHLRILRPGSITKEDMEQATGLKVSYAEDGAQLQSPGQLKSHYAPKTELRLNASDVEPDEALLSFGSNVPSGSAMTLNLSETGDLIEAAANLFGMLRQLDEAGMKRIAVMPIPEAGVGHALNDRLKRAATPPEVETP